MALQSKEKNETYLINDGIVWLCVRCAIDLLEQLEQVVAAPAQCVMRIGRLIRLCVALQVSCCQWWILVQALTQPSV